MSQGFDEKQVGRMAPPLVKLVDKILVELRKNMSEDNMKFSSDLDQRIAGLATKADLENLRTDMSTMANTIWKLNSDFEHEMLKQNSIFAHGISDLKVALHSTLSFHLYAIMALLIGLWVFSKFFPG